MSSASEPSEPTRSTSRVRLVPLSDVIQEVDNEDEFRVWIFDRVARGECNIYWRLKWPLCAFFDRRDEMPLGLRARSDAHPEMWRERPEVKFVRLATEDAQKFKTQDAVPVATFQEGLFVPDDVAANKGWLEAINFSGKIRVSHPDRPAPEVPTDSKYHPEQDLIKVWYNELYVECSARDDVHNLFDDSPSQEITPYMLACGLKPGWNSKASQGVEVKPRRADVTLSSVETEPVVAPPQTGTKDANEDDPYELQGRCDGVYMLYLTAERCSTDPEFVSASKPDDRKKIARETFNQLLDEMAQGGDAERTRQKNLRKLYGATRLDFALHLIDRDYDPNRGLPKEKWRDWPTTKGKALLARRDVRRQAFVTSMLRLIIGGARYWILLSKRPPKGDTTKLNALRIWLEDHGLTGVAELATASALITWNGQGFQTPPKFAEPSTSRDQAAGVRRASPRRT